MMPGSRKESDKRVINVMIGMYCHAKHNSPKGTLCDDCQELADYACRKTDRCVFGDEKRSCRLCAVHCYDAAHRARIREVMRYSGPRLVFVHPVMAVRHLIRKKF